MKKSLVAVGVIAALGAIWIGGSWYTGKLAEKKYQEIIAESNSTLNLLIPGSSIELTEFKRGLFESEAHFTVKAGKSIAAGTDSIDFTNKIEHGPFPISQLKHFNPSPKMATVRTELVNNATMKELFELTKGVSPYSTNTQISYSGSTYTVATMAPIDATLPDGSKVQFSGLTLNLDMPNNAPASIQAQIDKLVFSEEASSFSLEGLTFLANPREPDSKDPSFAKQLLTIKAINAVNTTPDEEDAPYRVDIANFNIESNLAKQDNLYSGNVRYSSDSLKIKNTDFGSQVFNVTYAKMDAATIAEFQKKNIELVKTYGVSSNEYSENYTDLLASTVKTLIDKNLELGVSPFAWKTGAGESTYTLNLVLQPENPQAASAVPYLSYFKKLTNEATFSEAMITDLAQKILTFEGLPTDEAAEKAKQQIAQVKAMGEMFGLLAIDGDKITSTFSLLESGKVNLNGKEMTVEELMAKFGQ